MRGAIEDRGTGVKRAARGRRTQRGTVEQRRLLGVIRSQDDTLARSRVPNAAELGREAARTAAAAPGHRELGWAERRLGTGAARREGLRLRGAPPICVNLTA